MWCWLEYTFTLLEETRSSACTRQQRYQIFTLPVDRSRPRYYDSVMKPLTVTITDDVPVITDTTAVAHLWLMRGWSWIRGFSSNGAFVTQSADDWGLRTAVISALERHWPLELKRFLLRESGAQNTTTLSRYDSKRDANLRWNWWANGSYTFTLIRAFKSSNKVEFQYLNIPISMSLRLMVTSDDSNQYLLVKCLMMCQ